MQMTEASSKELSAEKLASYHLSIEIS